MSINSLRYYAVIISILIIISSFSCSCEKKVQSNTLSSSTGFSSSDSTIVTPPSSTTTQRVFTVGSGGNLTIDGNNFVVNGQTVTLQNNDIIKINAGIYKLITIQNISVSTTGNPVVITNNGIVEISGALNEMYLSNLNNVTISGNGTSGVDRGFYFHDNTFRGIVMEGSTINNFTFQYASFKNIGDYGIYLHNNNIIYDGTANSYLKNLKFSYIDANNQGANLINLSGDIGTTTGSSITGLIDNLEIDHITCTNSPLIGTVVWLGNVRRYNIHDNYIDSINEKNDNHNGIVLANGNGKFYNNVIINHQGNAIRAWLYNVNSTDNYDVEIYNNIVWNSRKYGAFEVQATPAILASPNFHPANAVVYNNTGGKFSSAGSGYAARLLDMYQTNGTLSIYNNLLFNDEDDQIINGEYAITYVTNSNNIYKVNTTDAVYDVVGFVSKISGVGAIKP